MSSERPADAPVVVTDTVSSSHRIARRSVASWVLYDLANTCFSLGVVTMYFLAW